MLHVACRKDRSYSIFGTRHASCTGVTRHIVHTCSSEMCSFITTDSAFQFAKTKYAFQLIFTEALHHYYIISNYVMTN